MKSLAERIIELIPAVPASEYRPCGDTHAAGYIDGIYDAAELVKAEYDSLPVDEEWLRSVGFGQPEGNTNWQLPADAGPHEQSLMLVNEHWQWIAYFDDDRWHWVELPVQKSRGDVRRLCEALGIELKSEEPK